MSQRRRIPSPASLLLPAVLGVALLAAAACGGEEPDPEASAAETSPEERPVSVTTVSVEPETVVDSLSLPADLRPDRRAVLAAEVPGTVERLTVDEGDRVRQGQLLATVDTRSIEQALAEAEAVHERAADEAARAEKLFESRSITRSDLVAARSERDVARARLESAKLQLEKSRLRAPWAGRVAARRVEVGDYVVPGQAMIELVDTDPVRVRASIAAADVSFVEVGEAVEIRVSSLPGEELAGRVVRLAAELDRDTRTLDLEAEIPNPGGGLRPGMLAQIRIPRQRLEDALLVPLDALVDFEDRRVVYVVEDGVARRRTVELGPTLGDRVVVESGLEPGDRVIVRGQGGVAPGQRVEAQPVEQRVDRETPPPAGEREGISP